MTGPDPVADGLVVVDKQEGWTSHDVVARMRRLAGTRKVGHAGTLDPMATGVLVLGVGRGTKLLTFLVGCDKDYSATIRLGASTVTDDREGEVTGGAPAQGLAIDRIREAVRALTGDIVQVPSAVSAIKIGGERSYARVRAGEDVVLAGRPVRVDAFEVDQVRPGPAGAPECLDLDVRVTVSSGTYVRALARDLGAALGVGGHLTALRRTRVGSFGLDGAATLESLGERVRDGGSLPIIPLARAARAALPVRDLADDEARALSYGQRIASAGPRADAVAAVRADGELVAILDQSRPTTRSLVVFAPASS